MLRNSLSFLLLVQIVACVLSAGFSPAILLAFFLMLAAPLCFLKAMEGRGIMFVLFPGLSGILLFQGLILSPVFLLWFALVLIASLVCWNRGSGKPQFGSAG